MPSQGNGTCQIYTLEELRALRDSVCSKFRPAYFEPQFINNEGLFDPEAWFDYDRKSFLQRDASEMRRRPRRPSSTTFNAPVNDNGDVHLEHRINLEVLFTADEKRRKLTPEGNSSCDTGIQSTDSENDSRGLQDMDKDEASKHLLNLLQKPTAKSGVKHVRITDPMSNKPICEEEHLQFLSNQLRQAVLGSTSQLETRPNKAPRIVTVKEIEADLAQNGDVKPTRNEDQSAFYRLLGALQSQESASINTTNNNHSSRAKTPQEVPPSPYVNSSKGTKASLLQTPPYRSHSTSGEDSTKDGINSHGKNKWPMSTYSATSAPLLNGPITTVTNASSNSAFRWYRAINNAATAKTRISSLMPTDQYQPAKKQAFSNENQPTSAALDAITAEAAVSDETEKAANKEDSAATVPSNDLPANSADTTVLPSRPPTFNTSLGGVYPRTNGVHVLNDVNMRGMMFPFAQRVSMGVASHHQNFFHPSSLSFYYYRLAQLAASTGLSTNVVASHAIGNPSTFAPSSLYLNTSSNYYPEVSPALVAQYMQHKENLAAYLLRPSQLQGANMRTSSSLGMPVSDSNALKSSTQ